MAVVPEAVAASANREVVALDVLVPLAVTHQAAFAFAVAVEIVAVPDVAFADGAVVSVV